MNILVVDDDHDLLDAVEAILAHHGHAVDKTSDAAKGVEMLAAGDYDIVLADYNMPEKDGAWFLSNADVARGTKVILITAYANRDVINRMFKLGASGYIIKPFDEDDLLHNIEFHASRANA